MKNLTREQLKEISRLINEKHPPHKREKEPERKKLGVTITYIGYGYDEILEV